jgi:hypothetical protein
MKQKIYNPFINPKDKLRLIWESNKNKSKIMVASISSIVVRQGQMIHNDLVIKNVRI